MLLIDKETFWEHYIGIDGERQKDLWEIECWEWFDSELDMDVYNIYLKYDGKLVNNIPKVSYDSALSAFDRQVEAIREDLFMKGY